MAEVYQSVTDNVSIGETVFEFRYSGAVKQDNVGIVETFSYVKEFGSYNLFNDRVGIQEDFSYTVGEIKNWTEQPNNPATWSEE